MASSLRGSTGNESIGRISNCGKPGFVVFFSKIYLGRKAAMKRWFLPIIALLTIGLCLAFAGDFWKSKKYSTWSDEETKKMLEDSPWAHSAPVKYTFTAPPGGGMPGRGGMGGGMPPGGMGGGGMEGGGGFGPLGPPKQQAQTPKVTLRWQSALPIKQAIARARYKDAVETSEEAAKVFAREETQYILGVIGVMGAPDSFKPDVLKAGATLKIGELPPVPALDVLTDRQGMATNIYFAFPKTQPDAHVINENDKSLEFQLKTPNLEVKGKFSVKDMIYQDKLAI
jgi:hypothetical protein